MTRPTCPATGPCAPLPAPTPGPQCQTLAVALSAGESACLTAIAARQGWRMAHVAEHLLREQLWDSYLDDQKRVDGEVAP